jgi:hypothetical protein
MFELRHGRLRRCRNPNAAFVTLIGVALSASATCGGSTAAQQIPSAGGNLIANPDFDRGIAGWTPEFFTSIDADAKRRGWSASVTWAGNRDFEGRPNSGSLELAVTAAEGRCAWATQCVVAHPGTFELTGKVFIHTTNVHTGGAVVELEVFWLRRCDMETPALKHTRWSVDPSSEGAGRWTEIVDPTTFTDGPDQFNFNVYGEETRGRTGLISVPDGARGAHLRLIACVSGSSKSPETLVADFDHLRLRAIRP